MAHFRNARTLFRLAVVLLFFGGCSASGPRFAETHFATEPVPHDKARIVFYRDSDINFRAATVAIDGTIVGAVAQNGFVVAEVPAGEHKISAWVRGFFQEFVTHMTLEAGNTYYMRVSQRIERSFYPMIPIVGTVGLLADTKGEFQIELMPESTALQQLRDLQLSE